MKDRVIFITGAGAGIGFATAKAFARKGVHISMMSLSMDKMAVAKEEIEELGVKCLTFTGDVTDEEVVSSVIQETYDYFGGLHYAFNNVGIEQNVTPLSEQSLEDYELIVDTNLKGTWLCMKYQIPCMLKTKSGCIVNNSSALGLVGFPQLPLLVATHHAIIGLTKSVALEFAKQNIRINAICPGAVKTPIYERFAERHPDMDESIEKRHPIGRTAVPEEIANAVVWLCSPESSFVTGHALVIDGGYTIQ